MVFLKAEIAGYVALTECFAQFDVPVEKERAASEPLFVSVAEEQKIWAVVGYAQ